MPRVIVAGSINMDVVAKTARHPEPGQTVIGDISYHPGGKGANQACAASRAKAETLMIGKLGLDPFSEQLSRFLMENEIDTSHLTRTERAMAGVAIVVVDNRGENTIVIEPGANGLLTPADIDLVFSKGDVLVSQFETPPETTEAFFGAGRTAGAITLLNTAPALRIPISLLVQTDILVLNETELSFYVDRSLTATTPRGEIVTSARQIQARPDQVVIVTLGPRGCIAVANQRVIEVSGRKVNAVDTTGAGDCFIGSLAARVASGDSLEESIRFAIMASSICVQRPGAGPSMPLAEEVWGAMRSAAWLT
jgi:ribokinase